MWYNITIYSYITQHNLKFWHFLTVYNILKCELLYFTKVKLEAKNFLPPLFQKSVLIILNQQDDQLKTKPFHLYLFNLINQDRVVLV